MIEPVYVLKELQKSYGENRILSISRLEIQRGAVFALVGPSGAGKSTLLRLLNFLETPSSGEVSFEGQIFKDGLDMPLDLRRQVTTVFQNPVLLRRSLLENAAYGLRLRGEKDMEKAEAAVEKVGLSHLMSRSAKQLSGGEAQRVALARAICIEPKALLLDEPTANLDPYNVQMIEEIVQRMNQEMGVTVVLVTHNVFQARRLAHRVGFMLRGEMVEVSPTAEFFDDPKDPRTSAFVRGEMIY